jgi:hypothetical protein
MKAYKLFRELKNGDISSLFINKKERYELDKWMPAENHPTKGFAERPFWHCCSEPRAPHLSEKDRVWMEVEMDGYQEFKRPDSQGGVWYLADNIRILGRVTSV